MWSIVEGFISFIVFILPFILEIGYFVAIIFAIAAVVLDNQLSIPQKVLDCMIVIAIAAVIAYLYSNIKPIIMQMLSL